MNAAGRIRGTLAVCLLAFCASDAFSKAAKKTELSGYERFSLERGKQNHLLLHATVNGRPATFIIDTGAATTFLRADRATKFGIGRIGGDVEGSVSIDLRIGDKLFGNVSVAVYDPSHRGGYLPADGAIGLDLLRRYRAVINCRSLEIFFAVDPSRTLDLARTAEAKGFTRIPIEVNARGYLRVRCSIHGRPGRMLLDTGAFLTTLDERAVYALGISGTPSSLTAVGFDGQVRNMQLAQIDTMKIGPVSIPTQRLAVTNVFPISESRKQLRIGFNRVEAIERRGFPGEMFFGLLGNDLLDYEQAIIDLDSLSLFLK